ncbi:hypothetical protein Tco_0379273 [Tanacetum coccineum]
MHTMAGDGVTGIKRRRRDLYSDGVRNFSTASRRGRLKEDLESSTILKSLSRLGLEKKHKNDETTCLIIEADVKAEDLINDGGSVAAYRKQGRQRAFDFCASKNIDETMGEEYVEHADAGIVVMILKTLISYLEQGGQGWSVDISVNEDTIKADVDKAWGVFRRINALINNVEIAGSFKFVESLRILRYGIMARKMIGAKVNHNTLKGILHLIFMGLAIVAALRVGETYKGLKMKRKRVPPPLTGGGSGDGWMATWHLSQGDTWHSNHDVLDTVAAGTRFGQWRLRGTVAAWDPSLSLILLEGGTWHMVIGGSGIDSCQ